MEALSTCPLHSTHRFVDGRLVKVDPPEWFARATAADDGDWNTLLTKAGATAIDDFGGDGGADSIEIYEGPDGDYFIGFWDCNKCIAEVFIDNVADYLHFRATYIAPLANLIMESARHYEWEQEKRKVRRAS
jgi:hypothetical protein